MENCHAKNMKVTGSNHVGGLIGSVRNVNEESKSHEIKKCSVTECIITGNGGQSHGGWGRGGLIGTFFENKLKLKGCYATGKLYVPYGSVGALLGEERGWASSEDNKKEVYVEMTGCYSSMTIESNVYEDSKLTLMCGGRHTWAYTDCYYITSHSGQAVTSGLTYQPEITPEMINAMNNTLSNEVVYNADGTFQ